MSATLTEKCKSSELQLTTFYVSELLLGIPIDCVQEINRNLEVTTIPHAPDHVRGVINLRGEVTTVLDLRRVIGLSQTELGDSSRNLVVRAGDESVGLLVDRISDIITVDRDSIAAPPANVSGAEGKYFSGVYRSDSEIVVILDIEEILAHE